MILYNTNRGMFIGKRIFQWFCIVVFAVLIMTVRGYADTDITVTDNNNVTVHVNTDDQAAGAFIVYTGTGVTLPTASLGGLNSSTITAYTNANAAAASAGDVGAALTVASTGVTISGASATLNASGTINGVGIVSTGGLSNSGGAFNNNSQGITSAGAVSGVSTLTTSGNVTVGGNLDMDGGTIGNFASIGSIGTTTFTANTDGIATNEGFEFIVGTGGGQDVVTKTVAHFDENDIALNSATTVNGTLTATGLTTLNGGITADAGVFTVADGTGDVHTGGTLNVVGNTTLGGTLGVTGNLTATGTTNSIGSAGVSSNTLTGVTNTLTATGNNVLGAAGQNQLTGGTGNSVIATTGNNSISATAGSNSLTANAANQSNTVSATGLNGTNNITANATTGTNNIEAKTNNIGVATASSVNVIGNTTATNTMTGVTNTITSAAGHTAVVDAASARLVSDATGAGNNQVIVKDTIAAGYTAGNSSITVDNTRVGTIVDVNGITNSFNYGTRIEGGMYVNGSLGVNGNIYTLNPTASASVAVASNGLNVDGATNNVTLVADTNSVSSDQRAQLALTPDTGALTVVNTTSGDTHGVDINQGRTELSGGTTSTYLTLDDDGATFSQGSGKTGGPVKVTGVADGTSEYDAVNYKQLKELGDRADAGIATVAALAAIPSPLPGKKYSIGAGVGHHHNQDALAIGVNTIIGKKKDISLRMGLGYGREEFTTNAGIGWSW